MEGEEEEVDDLLEDSPLHPELMPSSLLDSLILTLPPFLLQTMAADDDAAPPPSPSSPPQVQTALQPSSLLSLVVDSKFIQNVILLSILF